jgi:hypothetical protein
MKKRKAGKDQCTRWLRDRVDPIFEIVWDEKRRHLHDFAIDLSFLNCRLVALDHSCGSFVLSTRY